MDWRLGRFVRVTFGRVVGVLALALCAPLLLVVIWVNGVASSYPLPTRWNSSIRPADQDSPGDIISIQSDQGVALVGAVLGIKNPSVRIVERWPWLSYVYLGALGDNAMGITFPLTGWVYLRSDLVETQAMGTVRGILAHELVHTVDVRSRGRLARAWRAARVPAIRDPGQYGYRNVYEQRAEAGEAALMGIIALEDGSPPEQVRNYLMARESRVPGTILMFRWMLSAPVLADRPWRQVTFFAEVPPLPAPWRDSASPLRM